MIVVWSQLLHSSPRVTHVNVLTRNFGHVQSKVSGAVCYLCHCGQPPHWSPGWRSCWTGARGRARPGSPTHCPCPPGRSQSLHRWRGHWSQLPPRAHSCPGTCTPPTLSCDWQLRLRWFLPWPRELQTKVRQDFTITLRAPTNKAFSWLKAPRSAFTLKTLLRHYA